LRNDEVVIGIQMIFNISCLSETGSTNDDVRKAAENGAAEGHVVWALKQKAGRGRGGRLWQSPEGNLYFSVLLRPALPAEDWGLYSFVFALAVSDAVGAFLPSSPIELKWPNDVLVGGQKICGILLEAVEGGLVAGVGINVSHVPENPHYPVTSLAQERAEITGLKTILDKVLESLNFWCGRLTAEGFAPVRENWLKRARKGDMTVRISKGIEIRGRFADLDVRGNLCLTLEGGKRQTISTGDVFF